ALHPFAVHGDLVKAGRRLGAWSLMARRAAAGEVPGWRVAEVLRLDGRVELARDSQWSPSLRLVQATLRRRDRNGTRRVTLEAEGDAVTIREGDAEPRVEAFGGVALAGIAPYVLLAPALARAPGAYRATQVYDDVAGDVRLAARDLVVTVRDDHPDLAQVALEGPLSVTLDVDTTSGTLRGLVLTTPEGDLELVERTSSEPDLATWDLLTAEPSTPVVAATRFLYALERGYLDLAARLVAWPAELGVPATDVASTDTPARRAWMEARRIELRRDLRPGDAAQRLRTVRAELEADPTRTVVSERGARMRLPAPYDGWDLLLVQEYERLWRIAGTAETPAR
ncbi:MAG: hypothetical protein KDB73_17915, partial [Planctomycetes bacterium]|nr:hypothetical protein [Planctomycetota bacterium]